MKLTKEKIQQIPTPSLGILAMVWIGINPKDKINYRTYLKHRAILRASGFDIEPDVKEMEAKK